MDNYYLAGAEPACREQISNSSDGGGNGRGPILDFKERMILGRHLAFRSWPHGRNDDQGPIGTYTTYDDAMAGVRVYDRSDKTVLFEAELDVYLQAERTGIALSGCGLPSLVRFGEPDHWAYATFTLSEDFIVKQSVLKIIGYKGGEPVYSPGWSLPDK